MNSDLTARGTGARQRMRQPINLQGSLCSPCGTRLPVRVLDISASGARIALDERIAGTLEGNGWVLRLPRLGNLSVAKKWRRGSTYGVQFAMPQAALDALASRLGRIGSWLA